MYVWKGKIGDLDLSEVTSLVSHSTELIVEAIETLVFALFLKPNSVLSTNNKQL